MTSPDGDSWQVGRRWIDRPLPNLRRRFRAGRKEASEGGALDGLGAFDLDGLVVGVVIAVAAVFVVVILLPLLGVALELVALLVVVSSGILGRVLLRRPWTVAAINLDDGERSVAYGVKGFRRAGHAVDELARTLAATGPPDRLSAGERTTLPRPGG